ncbi:hypothetical protein Tco_0185732 [Tanacetum coccineum]
MEETISRFQCSVLLIDTEYVFADVKCTDMVRLGKLRLELEEILKFLTQGIYRRWRTICCPFIKRKHQNSVSHNLKLRMLLKKRLKSCVAVVFEVPISATSEAKKEEIRKQTWWYRLESDPLTRADVEVYREDLRERDQMHQTYEKSSLAMTHKLDDMIELPKSQPKRTYSECKMVMVKVPRMCPPNSYDIHKMNIGLPQLTRLSLYGSASLSESCSLDMMNNKVDNPSLQNTPQVLPSFKEYTSPVTYPEEVEESLGTPIEEEPLNQTKLEDVGLTNHNIFLSSREIPSVDEPKPRLLPNCPALDATFDEEKPESS